MKIEAEETQLKRKLPQPMAAKSSPPVKAQRKDVPWRMAVTNPSSSWKSEPTRPVDATETVKTSEKEWYSTVAKKREEGHRSGWMNKMAILLVRVERGDSDEITELLKQSPGLEFMYLMFHFFIKKKPFERAQ